jgi:hypothetical protein
MPNLDQQVSESDYPENELNLTEIIFVVVQNLKTLIFVPLLAGAIVAAVAAAWPTRFESVAWQSGDLLLVAQYNSAQVRDHIIQEMKYSRPEEDLDAARERLAGDLKVTFSAKEKLVTIRGSAKDAQDARRMVTLAIEKTGEVNKRRTDALQRIKEQYELALQRDRQYASAIANLTQKLAQPPSNTGASSDFSLVQLLGAAREAQGMTTGLASVLAQAESFDVIQAPTTATRGARVNPLFASLVAALGTVVGLLLLIFALQAFRNAAKRPEQAQRLSDLKLEWQKVTKRGH